MMRMFKRALPAALALLLALCAGAAADSEGVVVQKSCNIVQSGEYYLVYCYAQIHNNSSEIICLEEGSFELHNGEQMLASQPVEQIWPYFINPGEDGYVFDVVAFEPGESGEATLPQVTAIDYQIQYMTVDTQFASYALEADAELVSERDGSLVVVCRITNPTDAVAFDPTLAFGLYTAQDQMLYAGGSTLKDVGIPAGGTVYARFPIDGGIVQQWQSYGAEITGARVSASFRNDED